MNGNFTFHNPTKLHFGEKAMDSLVGELKNYGPVVQLSYGGGSIKKNGIYDQVVAALESAGKTVVEDGGVMSNPTLERMLEGAAKAKANNVDLILAVGALTDATHGMTLSAVSLPYYRLIKPFGLNKFARFAVNVWGIAADGKSDEQLADEGLAALEAWMREIGVAMNITELGATEEMIPKIADATFLLDGGYKQLTRDEVISILRESL